MLYISFRHDLTHVMKILDPNSYISYMMIKLQLTVEQEGFLMGGAGLLLQCAWLVEGPTSDWGWDCDDVILSIALSKRFIASSVSLKSLNLPKLSEKKRLFHISYLPITLSSSSAMYIFVIGFKI